jgi:transposase
MVKIIVGIDIAKNVFQVHAADGIGATAYMKKLSRGQVLPFFAVKSLPTVTPLSRPILTLLALAD